MGALPASDHPVGQVEVSCKIVIKRWQSALQGIRIHHSIIRGITDRAGEVPYLDCFESHFLLWGKKNQPSGGVNVAMLFVSKMPL